MTDTEIDSDDTSTPDLAVKTDKRNLTRISMDRPMLIKLSSGDIVKARLVNLSCGGLAFEYPASADIGTRLTVLFQLSADDDPINIQALGVVKHTYVKKASFVIGLEFSEIANDKVDLIEEFIEMKISSASKVSGLAVSYRNRR